MQGVIFDMDGLMFDTERVSDFAWREAGKKLGYDITYKFMAGIHGLQPADYIPLMQKEFGEKFDFEAVRKIQREITADYYSKNGIPVKFGLVSLLKYLKANGYKLAVASSSSAEVVLRNLSAACVRGYFDAVITGDMIAHGKPEPDIFLKACESLSLKPSDCLVLEDSPHGILAAERAGMRSIMIPDVVVPGENEKKLAAFILPTLDKVINVLENGKLC